MRRSNFREGSPISVPAITKLSALEDFFRARYRVAGDELDLSGIAIHCSGADRFCDAWQARAITVGSDIYFRSGAYAPDTPAGLWLLAHELAHVVQQRRGPVDGVPVTDGWAVAAPDGPHERQADAAADAVLAGRQFLFGPPIPAATSPAPAGRSGTRVIQRFMAWEHLLLGNLEPADIGATIPVPGGQRGAARSVIPTAQLEAQCALVQELGRNPADVDTDRLAARFPGVRTVRLSASGLVVTLGELNVLPDYLSHPDDIDAAPASFVLPVVQAVRAQSYLQLYRLMDRRPPGPADWSTLRYPYARAFADIREAVEIDTLGRKCQFPASERYLSVLARNAGHFAPFCWYRWQTFHLAARRLIAQAATASGTERERLRSRAQVYAGYADHFLQDSFAAGHLANKTLVMQWYVEWLLKSGSFFADRAMLAELTSERQPYLHGPGLYQPEPGEDGQRLYPGGDAALAAITDPQSTAEGRTLEDRIALSGVFGSTPELQQHRYVCYLALLRSSVAQLATGVVHDHFNERSLVVAGGRGAPSYRAWGDRTMFAGEAGTMQAATAAHASRRAIADLLSTGETSVGSRQIFESMPSRVDVHGTMLPLPDWHDAELRDLCFRELFGQASTRARKLLLSLSAPKFGEPAADYTELRRRLARSMSR
jgi:Domain of unknown function (DUF4157)